MLYRMDNGQAAGYISNRWDSSNNNSREDAMLLVKPVLAVALLLSAPFGQTDEPPQGAIVVNIKDVASTDGRLIVALFSGPDGVSAVFNKSLKLVTVPANQHTAAVTFDRVPFGDYAVTVCHDRDGDGRLKTNFPGMPLEPVGNSNNPGGIPNFKKCRFEHSSTSTAIDTIRLVRLQK